MSTPQENERIAIRPGERLYHPALWLGAFVLLVCFGVFLGYELYESYQREFAIVKRDAENLTGTIERHVTTSSEKIDIVLQEVVNVYTAAVLNPAHLDVLTVNRDLLRREAGIPETQPNSLRIVDAAGHVLFSASTGAELPDVNVSDRRYFIRQRDDPKAALLVSQPMLSRVTGKWVFTLSRRLTHPDGSFLGLVQTAFRSEYFESSFMSIDVGPKGVIAMFSLDEELIAHAPPLPDAFGKRFNLAEIKESIGNGTLLSSFERPSQVDGIKRIYTFRKFAHLPLIVSVGFAPQDFLKGWERKAGIYITSAISLGLALVGLLFMAIRHSRRVEQLNERLGEEVSRAEAANRAKSAFLANMSHEIRSPLNVIIGTVSLLRKEGASAQIPARLDRMESASQHLHAVISDILDLSKIEADKLALETVPIDVRRVVGNVVAFLSDRAQAKGLALLSEIDDRIPALLIGDLTRLQQALLNYATNGVKFTETGSITLRASLLDANETTAHLKFEVEDTGVGVAPEMLPRLFESFEQADNSMNRKYGGTGLGLAITQHLATAMGGDVGARSLPGVGSTFWFTARLALPQAGSGIAREPTKHEDPESIARHYLAGTRVLLVDDDPMNQLMTREHLECIEMSVDVANSGNEAIVKAQTEAYQIILMDVQMPNGNGLDATRAIRQLEGRKTIPIIALTANAFSEDKVQCFEAGMDDFLTKPYAPSDLYQVLIRWLLPHHA